MAILQEVIVCCDKECKLQSLLKIASPHMCSKESFVLYILLSTLNQSLTLFWIYKTCDVRKLLDYSYLIIKYRDSKIVMQLRRSSRLVESGSPMERRGTVWYQGILPGTLQPARVLSVTLIEGTVLNGVLLKYT